MLKTLLAHVWYTYRQDQGTQICLLVNEHRPCQVTEIEVGKIVCTQKIGDFQGRTVDLPGSTATSSPIPTIHWFKGKSHRKHLYISWEKPWLSDFPVDFPQVVSIGSLGFGSSLGFSSFGPGPGGNSRLPARHGGYPKIAGWFLRENFIYKSI